MPLVSEHSIFIKQKLFSCFKKSTEQPQIYPFPGGSSKDAGCIHPMETPIRTACILVDGNCCGLCFTSASPAMLSNHKPSAWAAGTGGVCWWTSWRYCKAHSCRKLCLFLHSFTKDELGAWLAAPSHKNPQKVTAYLYSHGQNCVWPGASCSVAAMEQEWTGHEMHVLLTGTWLTPAMPNQPFWRWKPNWTMVN